MTTEDLQFLLDCTVQPRGGGGWRHGASGGDADRFLWMAIERGNGSAWRGVLRGVVAHPEIARTEDGLQLVEMILLMEEIPVFARASAADDEGGGAGRAGETSDRVRDAGRGACLRSS